MLLGYPQLIMEWRIGVVFQTSSIRYTREWRERQGGRERGERGRGRKREGKRKAEVGLLLGSGSGGGLIHTAIK